MSNLNKLIDFGQSYWLDNLTRSMIKSGELKNRITKQGLRGQTSNPAIFHKAISESEDYAKQIEKLAKEGKSILEIYDALTIKDVQDACDLFKPVYESSNGVDGYVSLEVSPYLAHNTETTLSEARRLFAEVNRPNCHIKIPGTPAGLASIEQALYEGINVNVTLLFSIKAYEDVANAFVNALERRHSEGKPIDKVASVASFFLSRIDVLTDQLLGHLINPTKDFSDLPRPEHLLGKTAIASAKLAYQSHLKIFSGERWEKLASAGAKVQRPLWASTSTKDPLYIDTKYVEPLIGYNTVNTLPEVTITAFAHHGKLEENTILKNVDEAYQVLADLKKLGIDIDLVTTQLTNDGVQKFIEPFDKLMKKLAQERLKYIEAKTGTQKFFYGKAESSVKAAMTSLNDKQFTRRLFAKDSYLWKDDPKVSAAIKNRLGWLGVEDFINRVDEINEFVKNVRLDKYTSAILLGMGGSSLCPEVALQTFRTKKGYLKLYVLDNTSPEAVKYVESQIDLNKSLFIVASKSGSTIESNSFYKYFYNLYEEKKIENAGKHFIAITDSKTSLEQEARSKNFRYIFTNPDDYGGRYSALSFFGLAPMALIGISIKEILNSAFHMKQSSSPFIPSDINPAVSLGVFLGINQKMGRDKATFVLSPSIKSFGLWVEQLIAESTGKEGRGILPVEGEKLGELKDYSKDRIFVYMFIKKEKDPSIEKKLASLEGAGFPVVRIMLPDVYALGGEFLRWEIATVTSCAVVGVNPFDEPNVSESKKNTNDLLAEWKQSSNFAEVEPLTKSADISVYMDNSSKWKVAGKNIKDVLNKFLKFAQPSDYISCLAYFLQTPEREKYLQIIRNNIAKKYKSATTIGYGPRYLHSTGQLHKGGPNSGIYILLTSESNIKLPIFDSSYDFATLQHAQALGDFRSLNNKNRRVLRIHIGGDLEKGLKTLCDLLK
jgi:transaldolase/glucose-6-phosphate isomerase